MASWFKRAPRPARARRPRTGADGFWDRPVLLNLAADLLFVLGGAMLAYAAMTALQRLPVFPLRQLVVSGPIDQVTPMQIEHAARISLSGNFFTVNLDTVRTSFEKLPWVRRAAVRRLWPDGVEVTIEEQVAAARWHRPDGESRLVNSYGEVFAASTDRSDLPAFAGPDGRAAQMLYEYQEFVRVLAPLGRRPQAVALTAREAWELRLDDGLVLELGRDQAKNTLTDRLARFVGAYRGLEQRLPVRPAVIDMRYPNGFALRPARSEQMKG